MNKCISLLLVVFTFLLAQFSLIGQVLDFCPTAPAGPFGPDETVVVSIPVTDYTDVVGFQFELEYDAAFFDYQSWNSEYLFSPLISNPAPGILRIQNSDFTVLTIPDGESVLELVFTTSAEADDLVLFLGNAISTIFIDVVGSSLPASYCGDPIPQEQTLNFCPNVPPGPYTAGQTLSASFPVTNFINIAAYNFTLSYDDNEFTFLGVSDEALSNTDVSPGFTGELIVSWNNNGGPGLNLSDGTSLVTIEFVVNEDVEELVLDLSTSVEPQFLLEDDVLVPYSYCADSGLGNQYTDLCLQFPSGPVSTGEQLLVDVVVSNYTGVTLATLPIGFDTSHFDFQGAFSDLPGEPVTTSWEADVGGARVFIYENDATSVSVPDGSVIIKLTFTARQEIDSVIIQIDPSIGTFSVSYDPELIIPVTATTCGNFLVGPLLANVLTNIRVDSLGLCDGTLVGDKLRDWLPTYTQISTGINYTAQTDQFGNAYLALPTAEYALQWVPPAYPDLWEVCPTGTIEIGPNTNINQPISSLATVAEACWAVSVEVSATNLRSCFSNNSFTVFYTNQGTAVATDAYIDLLIDEAFVPGPDNPAYTEIGAGLYRFQIGDLPPNESGQFFFTGSIDCDFPIGAAICAEATIHPFRTPCYLDTPGFLGGELSVTSNCEGDSIRFTIENTGAGPTGPVGFIIVEDVVIYMDSDIELNPSQSLDILVPSGGTTFRLETDLPTNAPYNSQGLGISEGCGTLPGGGITTGLVTGFSLLDEDPWLDRYCLETSVAYDPNDKLAIPAGVGPDNAIFPNQRMDYTIRFQNTGTDTAFLVVIRDTIDTEVLDVSSIRPGISSHDYRLNVEDNVMIFTFEEIRLVDSFTNEPLSNGFVHFSIDQQPDLAPGTPVENVAAIYFDFNEPIFTPPSRQMIQNEILISKVVNHSQTAAISLYPSPTSGRLTIDLREQTQLVNCTIFDAMGRQVFQRQLAGGAARQIQLQQLPPGRYAYRLQTDRELLQTGILVVGQ